MQSAGWFFHPALFVWGRGVKILMLVMVAGLAGCAGIERPYAIKCVSSTGHEGWFQTCPQGWTTYTDIGRARREGAATR